MELSCTRGAHFEKITFFVSDSFFYEIWLENESQKAAKMAPKTVKKSMVFFIEKKTFFYPKLSPKGMPNGARGRPIEVQKDT